MSFLTRLLIITRSLFRRFLILAAHLTAFIGKFYSPSKLLWIASKVFGGCMPPTAAFWDPWYKYYCCVLMMNKILPTVKS